MQFLQPATWREALEMKAAHREATPIAGGTDVMVEINLDHRRPAMVMDLTRVRDLTEWGFDAGLLRIGAGVTYTRIIEELGDHLPGLAMASRTVGSPQIRNRGTVGGNLGTASPAGDALPVLAAYDADIVVRSRARGERAMPRHAFLTGPKKTKLAPDELIIGARWLGLRGAGSFSKIGTRNAMVIAIAGLCLVVDEDRRRVNVALGSVGPTIIRATQAEQHLASAMESSHSWQDASIMLPDLLLDQFADLVASAAQPIDDVRGTAAYRRHGCRVLARRAISWALNERRLPAWL